MRILDTSERAAQWSADIRSTGMSIGFVPTMGALHQGHLDLVHRAKAKTDRVICSIFVNPLQFNDPADLARYPVRTEEDRRLLSEAGCDALYCPSKEEVFKGFLPKEYDLGGLDRSWEGPLRPGHFQGVVNVVERLFHYVRPDLAFFGEKDRQQLHIIRSVAERCFWPERVIGCPTVRDADGLALSSRNLRLNEKERVAALALHRSLLDAEHHAWKEPLEQVVASAKDILNKADGVRSDYFGLAHPNTLEPLTSWGDLKEVIAMVAAQVGPVRLIDNMTLRRP